MINNNENSNYKRHNFQTQIINNIIQYEILIYAYYPKENNKKLYKIVHIHHYNYSFIYKIELK